MGNNICTEQKKLNSYLKAYNLVKLLGFKTSHNGTKFIIKAILIILRQDNDFIVFEKQTRNGVYANKEAVPNQLEIFVMSQCPYGVLAENRIIDAMKLERLPKDVNVNIRYIVSEGRNGEQFSSLCTI